MDAFQTWLTNFTNNPTVISVVSVLSIIGGVLVVLSRTSIGKKALKFLTKKVDEGNLKIEVIKETVKESKKEYEQFKKESTESYNEFKSETSNKVVAIQSQFELFESDLCKILELIPNAKVQEQLKIWESTYSDKKEEIEKLIGDSYSAVQEKINEEVTKRTEESKQEIANLKSEIAILKELVEKTINAPQTGDLTPTTEDVDNGQTEETVND